MLRRRGRHEASLEILSDGSDLVHPAIFLTIRRRSRAGGRKDERKGGGEDDPDDGREGGSDGPPFYEVPRGDGPGSDGGDASSSSPVAARYALTGLPSLTSRLAADQTLGLLRGGAFRALLVPGSDGGGAALGGLPSLCLDLVRAGYKVAESEDPSAALRASAPASSARDDDPDSAPDDGDDRGEGVVPPATPGGYGDVAVVGPPGVGDAVDSVLDVLFGGNRRRPSLRVCEVPSSGDGWWEVHRDPFVKIWARLVPRGVGREAALECESCAAAMASKRQRDLAKCDGDGVDNDDDCDDDDDNSDDDNGDDDNAITTVDVDHNYKASSRTKGQMCVKDEAKSTSSSSNGSSDSDDEDSNEDDAEDEEGDGNSDSEQVNDGCEISGGPADGEQSVAYLVSLLPQDGATSYAFAVLPPDRAFTRQPCKCELCGAVIEQHSSGWNALRHLPEEIASSATAAGERRAPPLRFVLHLDPQVGGGVSLEKPCVRRNKTPRKRPRRMMSSAVDRPAARGRRTVPARRICVPAWASRLAGSHLATFPSDDASRPDPGSLVRAQERSRRLHEALPFAFPLNAAESRAERLEAGKRSTGRDPVVQRTARSCSDWDGAVTALGLCSCTSAIIRGWDEAVLDGDDDEGGGEGHSGAFRFVSRIEAISDRLRPGADDASPVPGAVVNCANDGAADRAKDANNLECAFAGGPCRCGTCTKEGSIPDPRDDNEIELDDELDDDSSSGDRIGSPSEGGRGDDSEGPDRAKGTVVGRTSPHLLALGTGCAAPSPLRGSSSYGLLLPTVVREGIPALALAAIVECGEGTLTALLRHLPPLCEEVEEEGLSPLEAQLSQVIFIWISHHHYDHYGDLPLVVNAIARVKRKSQLSTKEPRKPLLVIAPSKVIQYLNAFLRRPGGSSSGRAREGIRKEICSCVTHREFQSSPFVGHLRSLVYDHTLPMPTSKGSCRLYGRIANTYSPFASLRNVEAEHCRDAFALVLHIDVPARYVDRTRRTDPAEFVFCFSGDTRPSARLVRAFRSSLSSRPSTRHQDVPPPSSLPASLLLHEATFKHDDRGQADASRKRHSTSQEALEVAHRAEVDACVLTHFSQRYEHISAAEACLGQSYPFSWGVAMDGMMIPLTKRALANLPQLSRCVDSLLCHQSTRKQQQ
ncbi:hypothetical protein ACHAWF_019054 [Thalassiosira exigua]